MNIFNPESPEMERLVAVEATGSNENEACLRILYTYPRDEFIFFGELGEFSDFTHVNLPDNCTLAEWTVVESDDGDTYGVIHHLHFPKAPVLHFMIDLGETNEYGQA